MEGHAVIGKEIEFKDNALRVQHWVGEGLRPDHVELRMLGNVTFQADLQEAVYDLDFYEIAKLHDFLGEILSARRQAILNEIFEEERRIRERKAALLRDLDD